MAEFFPISGWAAIYDEADLNGDIVAHGAFRQSLAKNGAGAVKLLYQHTAETPIGRWLKFEERARGLYAEGELLLATQTAREVTALIDANIIDGLSIGFRTRKSRRQGAARLILEADLWEVSVVTFPMAPKARLITRPAAAAKTTNEANTETDNVLAFADHVRRAAKILSA
ncbi:MAG: HK97 family phage prohead protease [Parvularculaceae bacterium]